MDSLVPMTTIQIGNLDDLTMMTKIGKIPIFVYLDVLRLIYYVDNRRILCYTFIINKRELIFVSEKTFAISIIIIGVIAILALGIAIGYSGGINRAAQSARLVSYSESGYEISYDLIGTHSYK